MNPNDTSGLPSPIAQPGDQQPALPAANPAAAPAAIPAPGNPPLGQMPDPLANVGVPSSGHSTHAPAIADDADLIEKEWVNKAKAIVAKTKDNPSEQSKEINKFKADYLKKRYNKDIKVSET